MQFVESDGWIIVDRVLGIAMMMRRIDTKRKICFGNRHVLESRRNDCIGGDGTMCDHIDRRLSLDLSRWY